MKLDQSHGYKTRHMTFVTCHVITCTSIHFTELDEVYGVSVVCLGFHAGGAEYSVRKAHGVFYGHTHFINHAHQIQCRFAYSWVCNIKNRTFSTLASLLMDSKR